MGFINDIKLGFSSIPVDVRLLKSWININHPEKELCYLFVDSQGNAIEATADAESESLLASKLKQKCCYSLTRYITIESRLYHRVVPHDVSIRLGQATQAKPIPGKDIPHYYYCFARYDLLPARKQKPKSERSYNVLQPLTDYIGRIEAVYQPVYRAGKLIRKVLIQDEERNALEITFWNHALFPYRPEEVIGRPLVVTAMIVTEFNLKLQLESTNATTVDIAPRIPLMKEYITKFSQLPNLQDASLEEAPVSILEIKAKHEQNEKGQFTCKGTIVEIIQDKKWYNVRCTRCDKKVFMQKDKDEHMVFMCEDHDVISDPKFMFCVNAVIADETTPEKVIFYEESMSDLLGKSSKEMVIEAGYTDATTVPSEIIALRGIPLTLRVTTKKGAPVSVNRAIKNQGLLPQTPDPKPTDLVKHQIDSPVSAGKTTSAKKLKLT